MRIAPHISILLLSLLTLSSLGSQPLPTMDTSQIEAPQTSKPYYIEGVRFRGALPQETENLIISYGQVSHDVPIADEWNSLRHWDYWQEIQHENYASLSERWDLSTGKRYAVLLTDSAQNPIPNARVYLKSSQGSILWESRSDNDGRAELWSDSKNRAAKVTGIEVNYQNSQQKTAKALPYEEGNQSDQVSS